MLFAETHTNTQHSFFPHYKTDPAQNNKLNLLLIVILHTTIQQYYYLVTYSHIRKNL